MYTFSFCRDKALIIAAVTHKNNAPHQFEEGEDYSNLDPYLDGQLLFIKCMRGEVFLGIVILKNEDLGLAEGHLCLLPTAFGHSTEICKSCLTWIWKNTSYLRLVAPILENNSLARRCVEKVGFKNTGVFGKSHTRNNQTVRTLFYVVGK